jgi:hypothetical protein
MLNNLIARNASPWNTVYSWTDSQSWYQLSESKTRRQRLARPVRHELSKYYDFRISDLNNVLELECLVRAEGINIRIADITSAFLTKPYGPSSPGEGVRLREDRAAGEKGNGERRKAGKASQIRLGTE